MTSSSNSRSAQQRNQAPKAIRNWALAGLVVISLAAPVTWAAAGEGQGQSVLPSDPLAGRSLFLDKGCIKCHAIWGQGGTLGPDLARSGVRLTLLQLAGVLWNHSPGMIEKMRERRISRPTLSTEDMTHLAGFLYFLGYFDWPSDAATGQKRFAQKGCEKCHSLDRKGGSVGPQLDLYRGYASPLFMIRAMWAHGPAMAGKMEALHVTRPRFESDDLADIFAYIQEAATELGSEKTYMEPGSPARGEKVFVAKGCIKCHSVRGVGGEVGPDLAKTLKHQGIIEIAGRMWNHAPRMWDKMRTFGITIPQFSNQEISDLLAYLYFLQYFDPPGDAVAGQRVFMEKGCVLCHYAPPGGKPTGPDLRTSHAISSPVELCSAMWNHAPAMETIIRERGLVWPRLEGNEVRDLVAYLRSIAPAPAAAKGS